MEGISPYLARQFAPYARTFIDEYIQNTSDIIDEEEEELEVDEDGNIIEQPQGESAVVFKSPDLLDAEGNKVYSADQVEELLARCLAAISNRDSISSRYCTVHTLSHILKILHHFLYSFLFSIPLF